MFFTDYRVKNKISDLNLILKTDYHWRKFLLWKNNCNFAEDEELVKQKNSMVLLNIHILDIGL